MNKPPISSFRDSQFTLQLQKNIRKQGGSGEKGLACDTLQYSAVASQAQAEIHRP